MKVTDEQELVYLFCYGKAVDIWIAEQSDKYQISGEHTVSKIAKELYDEFWAGMPEQPYV